MVLTGGVGTFEENASTISVLGVAIGVGLKGGRIDNAFVKDHAVDFGSGGDLELFGGGIACEEVRVGHVHRPWCG